jgi:hypothetical protein
MADARLGGLVVDLGNHVIRIGRSFGRSPGIAVESAEQAMIGAEGNVNIDQPPTRRTAVGDQATPDRWNVLFGERPPVAPGHDRASRRKSVADGIAISIREKAREVDGAHASPFSNALLLAICRS